MKPSGILLFFLSVFIILFFVALYFPEDGIPVTGNLHIRFFTYKDIFSKNQVHYADIGKILSHQRFLNDSVISSIAEKNSIKTDTTGKDISELLSFITRIEYPKNDSTLLHPFFRSLKNSSSSGQLIRIMHYGDSQIEDDRITSLLRNRLQAKFGGLGAGLVPASQLYPYGFTIRQENSENWYRYIGFGKTDTTINHRRYGALASYCSFIPSGMSNKNDTAEAWVRFSKSTYSYDNTKDYNQCRIFYGFNKEPFISELYIDEKLTDADIFPSSGQLKVIRWTFDSPSKELMLKFKGNASPEIYGIALDGIKGVAVDNIPLRGCSGLFFTTLEEDLLKAMYKELNVKLFILQFGGNFVPAGLHDYSGYEKWFSNQLQRIKKICPDAAILVIGVADMSVKEKNSYRTYPSVELVRNALRNAAFKSGAAFWDMYKAMGGMNSMPSWVFADPPLAAGDFVHFNARGARTIAQMFYNAFIFDYHRFEKYAQ
jgi:hypothetical protein